MLNSNVTDASLPTTGSCGLFRPGSRAVIGVLGNSIAWGHGMPGGSSWPALLNRSLRARFGSGITVVNGAVRASTPDFASLCWEEIWGSRRAPHLDVAVVDYSASGEVAQLRALQDRIESRSIPSVGLAYCTQPDYLTLLQCAATGNASERCRRWARVAATAASLDGTDAIDEAFWCDRGRAPLRGPAAAAREIARFVDWGVLEPPLTRHALQLYEDAVNGTEAAGRAGVRAAFAVAAALSAKLGVPRSLDAVLARDEARGAPGLGLEGLCREGLSTRPGGAEHPGGVCRCLGHCQGASRMLRLGLRRCNDAALREDRAALWLSRATTSLAALECHATDYHQELHRRSAAVAFPRELLATPQPNASMHGDGLHPGALGHAAMAASVEARCRRCNPTC